ncbi:unnamed protein product [Rhizophagus irregularis]|nr:unnamed protein product [Rhizophagus irregularis]CAB4444879.1 unnamed protein product [Rhizophagus irregularis]
MNIIALMPATKAYEVLFRNWGGYSVVDCAVWEEDYNRHFITYIPPDAPHNGVSYHFNCATFNGMDSSADIRNGVLTQKTLDNSTTYWVIFAANDGFGHNSNYKGGYNTNTCFHVLGGGGGHWKPRADLYEAPYEECQQIRDSK